MSRTIHQSKKGLAKCSCGHYKPCPVLELFSDLEIWQMVRKHKDRRIEVRHPISEEE